MTKTGRPTGMPHGRPTDLTPEVIEAVVKIVSAGVMWQYAAVTARVSTRTLHDWMRRGEAECARLDEDPEAEPLEREAIYAEFWLKVEHARQTAAQRSLLLLQQAARGGYVTETSTRKNRDGSVETTEKRQGPDWRAADRWLVYFDRGRFGTGPQQVEVTGAGGGPLQVEGLGGLAARVAAVGQQRQAELENVIDAEVEEDE